MCLDTIDRIIENVPRENPIVAYKAFRFWQPDNTLGGCFYLFPFKVDTWITDTNKISLTTEDGNRYKSGFHAYGEFSESIHLVNGFADIAYKVLLAGHITIGKQAEKICYCASEIKIITDESEPESLIG